MGIAMKRIFGTPEIKVVSINVEDVITTSGNTGAFDGEWVPIGK